jgi:hypothetical protein
VAIEPGISYHEAVNWPALILYGGPLAAVVAGAALGYRRTHRTSTAFLGIAAGIALVILANWLVSNNPIGGGDLSDRIVLTLVGIAVVILYASAFVVSATLGWVLHRRERASRSA